MALKAQRELQALQAREVPRDLRVNQENRALRVILVRKAQEALRGHKAPRVQMEL